MCSWLIEKTGTYDPTVLHVALEVPHGAVVETMLERGMVVHSINPKQLDRFRDRFTVAGAKDDRRDAHVLADSLRTDRPCFRPLKVDHPTAIELREWSRIAEDLQDERVRLGNRLRQQLLRYYPQILELADNIAKDWFLGLWSLVPTPKDAARAREKAQEPPLGMVWVGPSPGVLPCVGGCATCECTTRGALPEMVWVGPSPGVLPCVGGATSATEPPAKAPTGDRYR